MIKKKLLWLRWALFVIIGSPFYISFAFIHLIGHVLNKADDICIKMIETSIKLKRSYENS